MKYISSLLWLVLFASCATTLGTSYGTLYTAIDNYAYYHATIPCNIPVLVKFNEEGRYQKIGTCTSRLQPEGFKGDYNIALQEVRKCACRQGAEVLLIVEVEEHSVEPVGLLDRYNPNYPKAIYEDMIKGDLFRKID